MRISDWSSDVCSSDLCVEPFQRWTMCFDGPARDGHVAEQIDGSFKAKPLTTKVKLDVEMTMATPAWGQAFSSDTSKMSAQEAANAQAMGLGYRFERSEEHTSELQSLMRISYAVFCLKTKTDRQHSKRARHRNNKLQS